MAAQQKNRLPLLLVIGGVLIVALLLAKFVLFKGSSSPKAISTTTTLISNQSQSSTTTSSTLPLTFDNSDNSATFAFSPDPFIPKVAGVSGVSTGGTPTSGTTSDTTQTTTSTTIASGSVSPTTTQLPTSLGQGQYGLQLTRLISVQQTPGAAVKVDGRGYTVSVGQTFAQNYRLVSVDNTCAQFVYGDEPFRTCTSAK